MKLRARLPGAIMSNNSRSNFVSRAIEALLFSIYTPRAQRFKGNPQPWKFHLVQRVNSKVAEQESGCIEGAETNYRFGESFCFVGRVAGRVWGVPQRM